MSSDEEAEVPNRGGGSRQSLFEEGSEKSTPEKKVEKAQKSKYHGTGLGSSDDDSSDDDFRNDSKSKQNDDMRTGLETSDEEDDEGGDANDYGLGDDTSDEEKNEVCTHFPLLLPCFPFLVSLYSDF